MAADPSDRTQKSFWSTFWILHVLIALPLCGALSRGAVLGEVVQMWAFLLLYVVVPGSLVYELLRGRDEDGFFAAGMAWVLGYVLLTLGYLSLKILRIDSTFTLYPAFILAVAIAIVARRRRAPGVEPVTYPRVELRKVWPLAILLVLVACKTPFHGRPDWWWILNDDLLFHAGNAAELRNNWPLEDPRLGGQPLIYHFFAYAIPASASQVTGMPIGDVMYGVGGFVTPMFLAVQIYNAARLFAASHIAGMIASVLVMLHVDVGRAAAILVEQLGLDGGRGMRLGFHSHLDLGIFASSSTAPGLMLVATLVILLHRWLAQPGWISVRNTLFLAGVACVTSGVKGSIMPVFLAGLGATFAWRAAVSRRFDVKMLAALAILAVASAPMMVFLAGGEQSFATGMFRFEPFQVVRVSGGVTAAMLKLGIREPVHGFLWTVLAVPFWILGYLDWIGIGACVYWVKSRRALSETTLFLLFSGLAGCGASLLFTSPGLSQLFFLYTSQVGLAILAGAGLAPYLFPSTRRGIFVSALLWLSAVPMVAGSLHALRTDQLRRPADVASTALAYRAGLDWMRTELPRNAVVIANHPGILLSSFAERRAWYENDRYTPKGHAMGWSRKNERWKYDVIMGQAFPEHVALRDSCFSADPTAAIEEVKARLTPGTPLYVLYDDVRYRRKESQGGKALWQDAEAVGNYFVVTPLAPPEPSSATAGWKREFSNDVMHLYRVNPP